MQHMRDLGFGGGGSVMWVEASAPPQPKRKQKLEDALREVNIDDTRSVGTAESSMSKARSLLPEEVLPSEFVRKRNYQDQQDVPDAIAGFQPDMDPRLREVLEALEDEEYVDDLDDDDVFGQLVEDGEVDEDEFDLMGEQMMVEEDDNDGWESDDTIKAASPPSTTSTPMHIHHELYLGHPEIGGGERTTVSTSSSSLEELKDQGEMIHPPTDAQAQPPADPTSGAWLDEYKKFKSAGKSVSVQCACSPHKNHRCCHYSDCAIDLLQFDLET
jgi:protein LTV1